MAEISITKQFRFSMGHALWLYKGKCFNLHGHNYLCEITVNSEELDELGFVTDFANIKDVAEIVDEQWDHKTLVNKLDPRFDDKLPGVVKVPWNPTAENLTAAIFALAVETLEDKFNVKVSKVTLWETDTSFASITK